MDKLAKHDKMHNIFDIVKFRFPHIDFQTLNPELSFSQNLHVHVFFMQNIIAQLGLPSSAFEVNHQITNMKEAVDRQQLKIQTSLVNDENVDITNRVHRKSYTKIDEDMQDEGNEPFKEMDYESLVLKQAMTRNHDYQSQEIIQEIWMFDSVNHNGNGDWFQT